MNRARILGLLGLVPTLLCTSCASLPGAWYYQAADAVATQAPEAAPVGNKNTIAGNVAAMDAEGDKGTRAAADPCDSGLYFAVLNNRRERLEVTKVEINGGEASGTGWTCVGKPKPINAGQLLVLKLPLTERANCAVPLDARLWTSVSGRPVPINVPAAMPSALPLAWLQCPRATGATCTNASKDSEPLDCTPTTDAIRGSPAGRRARAGGVEAPVGQ